MIVAEIVGGLGNQLFQYAAARALADHHKVPLLLDISFYQKSRRNFMLDNFCCNTKIADNSQLKLIEKKPLLNKIYQRLQAPHKRIPFFEPHYHYYPDFLKAPSKTYLKGLWQSEKYFISIKDIISKEFEIKADLVRHLQPKAAAMRSEKSISIHIRRGDYLHPKIKDHFGLLSDEYYLKAISTITEKFPNPKIYFFSDDIEFVKKFISENKSFQYDYEFITGNLTNTDLEDFYLMQNCKHNITANSTFSWWSAWLNPNNNKMIVAPKQWYNNPKINYKDLVPDTWFRV